MQKYEYTYMYMLEQEFVWWKHGVVYQIYPRSYKDTTGNGVGDLQGVIEKLDYIASLGVSAIWLNPFFASPMVDFGYDISDYYMVDPLFGNNTDLLLLITEAHKRGLKIILDMVLNHTSDQHPWFTEARSSKDNPKRDWYVWRDKPNNWESIFGGSAWEKCPFTGEYYYHAFLSEQPDLNLRNPEVVEEIKKIFRHYMEMGVDGFRLDAVNTYYEDAAWRNNPELKEGSDLSSHSVAGQRRVYNYDHYLNYSLLDDLREVTDEYPNRLILGEVGREGKDEHAWKKYYGSCNRRLDLVFNFDLLYGELSGGRFGKTLKAWESLQYCSWPSYALSSHDQIRAISRVIPDQDACPWGNRGKLLAVFLMTVRGTPFVYYGEELGMPEYKGLTDEQIQDPWSIRNNYTVPTRDGCRTPMIWDDSKHAGFSLGSPWLPVHETYKEINAAAQQEDQASMLEFYKELIQLRNGTPALHKGDLEIIIDEGDFLQYRRIADGEVYLVSLNFSAAERTVEDTGKVVLSSDRSVEGIEAYGFEIWKLD